jgi:hypothetical protein
MATFVNRLDEAKLIDDAFKALQNYGNDSLLRTPIIDFFGVEGIGKTAVLKYIEDQCKKQQIRYILINASQNARHFSHEIVRQAAERYNIGLHSLNENDDPLQQSLYVTKALLEQGTAVMILDSVEATNEDLLKRIAITLRDVINDKKLFVALASKRGLLFDFERSISRKLTSRQLKPLERKSCEYYLDMIEPPLTPETKKYILDWTRGYPLAMEVMTTAITEHKLDPAQPEDQKKLVDLIVERVLDQKVFAKLAPPEQSKYKEVLTILSLPRRFNLVIMQELIERFAPDQKRGSSLAYMKLPSSIKNDTDVLNWNVSRGGFAVDIPIRHIFLLKIRLKQTERYSAVHQFLAQLNKTLAGKVTTSDRIHYLCEYLYHSAAYVKSEQEFIQLLEQALQEIIATPFESFESFKAFEASFEELLQDNEFREALGEQTPIILSLIYKHLAEMNKQKARKTSGEEHFYHLRNFFVYSIKDPKVMDIRSAWVPAIHDIIAEEHFAHIKQFVEELLNSETLKESLGSHFDLFAELVSEISLEG